MSKTSTSGVTLDALEDSSGGCERMICHVLLTDGVQGSVVFGEGSGVRGFVGEVVSSEEELPRVRPMPRPRARARMMRRVVQRMRSLRRRDQGGLEGMVGVLVFCLVV